MLLSMFVARHKEDHELLSGDDDFSYEVFTTRDGAQMLIDEIANPDEYEVVELREVKP